MAMQVLLKTLLPLFEQRVWLLMLRCAVAHESAAVVRSCSQMPACDKVLASAHPTRCQLNIVVFDFAGTGFVDDTMFLQ